MPQPWRLVLPLAIALCATTPAGAGAASSGWPWPVVGPVLRGFELPAGPYGAGHRGIDIAVTEGTQVRAPAPGVVSFAGCVGGQLFVTLDHGGGLQSTYSWLSAALVRKGDAVAEGAPIALSGLGHPGSAIAHLHFGVKFGGNYVDPMVYLSPGSVVNLIRLAPIPATGAA
jgi:murein DD-endopeptidase MepM/ murein hydrolase activator NlpD